MAGKAERLLNLVILLMGTRSYLTKEQIRGRVEAYSDSSDDAFEKMFERDKEELRSLGVPVELGQADRFFEDEPGYRIRPDAFALPEIDFAPDERAVLGLAARVWRHSGLAATTSGALLKLRAGGVEIGPEIGPGIGHDEHPVLEDLVPTPGRLVVDEPAFDALWQATVARQEVAFGYRRPGDLAPTERHLQPWGVVSVRNRWYVVGHDLDRGAPRSFRLSRIDGEVRLTGIPGGYTVPEGTDVRQLTARLAPHEQPTEVTVLARTGAAIGLRRWADSVEEKVTGPDERTGWDRLRLTARRPGELVGDLLGYGDVVYLEGPAELRERLVDRLHDLVGEAGQ